MPYCKTEDPGECRVNIFVLLGPFDSSGSFDRLRMTVGGLRMTVWLGALQKYVSALL